MATAAKSKGKGAAAPVDPREVARFMAGKLASTVEDSREAMRAGLTETQFLKYEGARQVLADLSAEVSQGQ